MSRHLLVAIAPLWAHRKADFDLIATIQTEETVDESNEKAGKPLYFIALFTAVIRKPLIITGAGEGNRTLVTDS